jgi:clumping factor A
MDGSPFICGKNLRESAREMQTVFVSGECETKFSLQSFLRRIMRGVFGTHREALAHNRGEGDPNPDVDGDGLSNFLEAKFGTNPANADTDGDGLSDGDEMSCIDIDPRIRPGIVALRVEMGKRYFYETSGNFVAFNWDGAFSNADGYRFGTQQGRMLAESIENPFVCDGLWAYSLIAKVTNVASCIQMGLNGSFMAPTDGDLALIYNDDVFGDNSGSWRVCIWGRLKIDPRNPDADGDGMPDGWEVQHGLNPLVNDANGDLDGDGMPNKWEYDNGLNPNNPNDANEDYDNDGLRNIEEYQRGTRANNPDTDGDGIPDGVEVAYGLNPTNAADANEDTDGDGWSNVREYEQGTIINDANDTPTPM